jgi:hypothetical protein
VPRRSSTRSRARAIDDGRASRASRVRIQRAIKPMRWRRRHFYRARRGRDPSGRRIRRVVATFGFHRYFGTHSTIQYDVVSRGKCLHRRTRTRTRGRASSIRRRRGARQTSTGRPASSRRDRRRASRRTIRSRIDRPTTRSRIR